MLRTLISKERQRGETRVAGTPETVQSLVRTGLEVWVERDAGSGAFFSQAQYEEAGAKIVKDARDALASADIVLKVAPPMRDMESGIDEVEALKPGAVVIGHFAAHQRLDDVRRLAERNITSLAIDLIPRISRAQGMDALSSQASIAGYKAIILAASRLGRYFPLLMTAAGTVPPARVLVLGAGVAGLQAVATANRLGARIWASDVRPAAGEEVASLGGRFVLMPGMEGASGVGQYAAETAPEVLVKQQQALSEHVVASDVVICTAQVPGKPSPRLVTASMIEKMRPGSVVVDLTAEQGGNCELSQVNREVTKNNVLILAPSNLPASMPIDASVLYARNLLALVHYLVKDDKLNLDVEDEIVGGTLLTHRGRIVYEPVAKLLDQGVV